MSSMTEKWWDLLKSSVEKTEIELNLTEKTKIGLLFLDETYQWFSVASHNNKSYPFIAQAWITFVKILKNELFIEEWDTITVRGRYTSFSIFSLKNNVFLVVEHETTLDPLDIIKTMLKYVFELGYNDKYTTIGLVASEGYPVWVVSTGQHETDEFLFAISITSLLSLVERLDMEVNAGGITSCALTGESSVQLNVVFNPSQDLVLATTQSYEQSEDEKIPLELQSILNLVRDPSLYTVHLPEIVDKDRERMLEKLKQTFEGAATEEEIQTLTGFEESTLQRLEEEIKSVSKKYRADEISIGYLRRRMHLPPEVLSMSLQFLISNGKIQGKIGRSRTSGQEILLLDGISEKKEEELKKSQEVKNQIKDLFLVLEPYLSEIPKVKKEKKAEFKEALSEYQIMLSLADSDPLFLLMSNIRGTNKQLESSVKGLILLKKQIAETSDGETLVRELEKRFNSLSEKTYNYQLDIYAKSRKLYEDLLNYFRLLLRLLPVPSGFIEENGDFTITFQCHAHNCGHKAKITDKFSPWAKLAFFSVCLKVSDEFPEFSKNPSIREIKDELQNIYTRLEAMTKEEEIEYKLEYYPFLSNIDDLIISNTTRDNMISNLQQKTSFSNLTNINFFKYFKQCDTCKHWYCNEHIKNNKCIYC